MIFHFLIQHCGTEATIKVWIHKHLYSLFMKQSRHIMCHGIAWAWKNEGQKKLDKEKKQKLDTRNMQMGSSYVLRVNLDRTNFICWKYNINPFLCWARASSDFYVKKNYYMPNPHQIATRGPTLFTCLAKRCTSFANENL